MPEPEHPDTSLCLGSLSVPESVLVAGVGISKVPTDVGPRLFCPLQAGVNASDQPSPIVNCSVAWYSCAFLGLGRRQGAVTDMVSITISLGVFLSYWVIEQMPPFKSFQFQDGLNLAEELLASVLQCCLP